MWGVVPNGDCDAGQARGPLRAGGRRCSVQIITTAFAEMKWRNGFTVGATFEGEFSNVTRSYAGKGVVRDVW